MGVLFRLKEVNFETLLPVFWEVSACFWYTEGGVLRQLSPSSKNGNIILGVFEWKNVGFWFIFDVLCWILKSILLDFWLFFGLFEVTLVFFEILRATIWCKDTNKKRHSKIMKHKYLKMQYIYKIYNKLKMSLVSCLFAMCWYIFKKI